jgi:DNA-3-methyladenine glycosylase
MSHSSPKISTSEQDMLDLSFFDRDPHVVAKELLGCILVRDTPEGVCRCKIVEVEVYGGVEDGSSHANSSKPTRKSASMFLEPGTVYVYSIHRYHCLNVVTRAGEKPSAILIRAAKPLEGLELMAARRGVELKTPRDHRKLLSGPGKMCQALHINKNQDGLMYDTDKLYFESMSPQSPSKIIRACRVGLNAKTCGESTSWPWRYLVSSSNYVSRKARR